MAFLICINTDVELDDSSIITEKFFCGLIVVWRLCRGPTLIITVLRMFLWVTQLTVTDLNSALKVHKNAPKCSISVNKVQHFTCGMLVNKAQKEVSRVISDSTVREPALQAPETRVRDKNACSHAY